MNDHWRLGFWQRCDRHSRAHRCNGCLASIVSCIACCRTRRARQGQTQENRRKSQKITKNQRQIPACAKEHEDIPNPLRKISHGMWEKGGSTLSSSSRQTTVACRKPHS